MMIIQTNFPEIDGKNGYVNTNKFSRNNGKNHEFAKTDIYTFK